MKRGYRKRFHGILGVMRGINTKTLAKILNMYIYFKLL